MKNVLLGLAMAGLIAAQTPAPKEPGIPAPVHDQKRIFQVKYADVRSLRRVLDVFGYRVDADTDLHVVAVSAPADVMTAIEDAIKRLDVPSAAPHDINLTVYLLLASERPGSDEGLPDGLPAVANQLKGVFAFKSFRMLDTLLLRTQQGNTATGNGIISSGPDAQKTNYHFSAKPSSVTDDPNGAMIRLDNLSLNLKVPMANGHDLEASINTEITVREGQKVVVGKSNLGTPDQALILVVTAKTAE